MWVPPGHYGFAPHPPARVETHWKRHSLQNVKFARSVLRSSPSRVYRQLPWLDLSHSFIKLSIISCKWKVFLVNAAHEVRVKIQEENLSEKQPKMIYKMFFSWPPSAGHRPTSSLYRWVKWGSENARNSSKFTQLIRGGSQLRFAHVLYSWATLLSPSTRRDCS